MGFPSSLLRFSKLSGQGAVFGSVIYIAAREYERLKDGRTGFIKDVYLQLKQNLNTKKVSEATFIKWLQIL